MELMQCFIYVSLIGVAANFIGLALPRQWFDPEGILFRKRHWEQGGSFYARIKIRKWKDKLPDASKKVRRMYRKKIELSHNEKNLCRLVEETCVAEFIHILLIILSLGVTRIWRGTCGWVCWLLCVAGNLPFIWIQRFNRPRLQAALEREKCRKIL